MLKNKRLLHALRGEPVDATPIWIMRQAGRYLPEYRETRKKAGNFMALCKNPELACEVTLQPLARFDLDAAILFSDILTIPDAMGLGLSFGEGEGPRFAKPIRTPDDIKNLGIPDPNEDLRYVMDAVRTIKRALHHKVPLIGFSGSPWTLATYMIEGGSSKQFGLIKAMLYQSPQHLHQLLLKLAQAVTLYLQAQIDAGVEVVQIFDTWGGILAHDAYQTFSLQYMQQIVAALKQYAPQVPVIVFTKNGGLWLESIADSGCTGVGVDWTISLSEARARVGHRVALQGNLDPAVLHADTDVIEAQVKQILSAYDGAPGHVFNLGHGITPDIHPDKVAFLVDAVHRLSGVKSLFPRGV
jgi:uroporphyrinogen decarboxylase